MTLIEWKDVTHDKQKYKVSREEFPTKVVYTAWEPAEQRISSGTKFITERSHGRLYHEGRDAWGAINERALPEEIEKMTPRIGDRLVATEKFVAESTKFALTIIFKAYEEKIRKDKKVAVDTSKGQAIIKRGKAIELPEPAKKHRNAPPDDKISSMLVMADMPKMMKLAKANGVAVKPSDTAGLLKMRLSNKFRHIVKSGGTIVE